MDILLARKNIKFKMGDGTVVDMPCLIPAFRHQFDAIRKLPMDRVIDCKAKVSRNAKLNQKFWSITNFVFDNLPEDYEFRTIEQFVDWIKLEVGFTEVYKVAGKVRVYGRSIAFSNCDELSFRDKFYNPALALYAQILGIPVEEIEINSIEYSGIDYRNKNVK